MEVAELSETQRRLRTLLAGGLAGCIAKSDQDPFSGTQARGRPIRRYLAVCAIFVGRISGVFRVMRIIFHRDGLFGLYRGHSAMLLRIFPYAGTNFLAYEQFKRWIHLPEGIGYDSLHKLLCGSMAGATAVTLTYPLDMIRARLAYQLGHDFSTSGSATSNSAVVLDSDVASATRIKPEAPKNVFCTYGSSRSPMARLFFGQSFPPALGRVWGRTLSTIFFDAGGISRFYRGYSASLCGIVPYAGVSFCVFETLKRIFSCDKNVAKKFLAGLVAGACGQTAAYPFDVVRRRMQLDRVASHIPVYRSIFEALSDIYRTSGVRGLYIGISINYMKVAPATAISFVVYEALAERLGTPRRLQ